MSDNDNPSSSSSEPSAPVQNAPAASQEAAPTPYGVTNVEALTNAPASTDPTAHDKTDVESALQRTTQDGPGEGEAPPSDFDSFATSGVEVDDETDTGFSDEDIADQVLRGKWGAGDEKREKLQAHGYDPIAIAKIVNRRLTGGAPNVFPTSVRDDAIAVIRGEWGDEETEIKGNLARAGKNVDEVWAERTRQLGL